MEFIAILKTIAEMKTNELIVDFVIHNIILLGMFISIIAYITSKTKTKLDNDLPGFLSGLINSIKREKK